MALDTRLQSLLDAARYACNDQIYDNEYILEESDWEEDLLSYEKETLAELRSTFANNLKLKDGMLDSLGVFVQDQDGVLHEDRNYYMVETIQGSLQEMLDSTRRAYYEYIGLRSIALGEHEDHQEN